MIQWSEGHEIGPYVLVSLVGEGGMGEVWKARDSRLDRIVAIKRLKGDRDYRFQQEARVIAALNHPHICQIYDVGPDYLVLEYIDGKPLRGPMEPAKAVKLAIQMASALELAHKRGILHRDLKPANVFETQSGAKLLDFGLAKLMRSSDPDVTRTTDGVVVGTAAYMSPEQAQGWPLDERSDIFSFGAVLYELISGNRAFAGDTMAQVLTSVLRDNPVPLNSALDNFLSRCMSKQPAKRFQSISEVQSELERLLSDPTRKTPPPSDAIDSIAVLPFVNNANDPDTEYLCDGIAENIMNSLSQVAQLRVLPRSTTFRYKSRDADPQTIGRELGVRAVLTGRVSQRGDNLLVGTELVDAAAGAQLWGERFHRKISDLFELEEEIARKISESLRAKLTGGQPAPAEHKAKRFTQNTEAYQLYLRGRHHWGRRTPEDIRKSAELFQKAIDKDPSYASAYTGLADCYSILGAYSILPPKECFARAKAAAGAALVFDGELAEAHTSLGFIRAYFDWDWPAAEACFQRAVELNPDYWGTRYWYALFLTSLGRFDDAEIQIARGFELEPLSPVVMHGAMLNSACAGRYDQTIERGLRGIENDPRYFLIRNWLGLAYAMKGQWADAIRESEEAVELSEGKVTWVTGSLGYVYAASGHRAAAEGAVSQLLERERIGGLDPTSLLTIYVGLGEHEKALRWLERGSEVGGLLPVIVKVDPRLKPLHPEPRFQAVLRKLRLA